jgi:hypothetical protein
MKEASWLFLAGFVAVIAGRFMIHPGLGCIVVGSWAMWGEANS